MFVRRSFSKKKEKRVWFPSELLNLERWSSGFSLWRQIDLCCCHHEARMYATDRIKEGTYVMKILKGTIEVFDFYFLLALRVFTDCRVA